MFIGRLDTAEEAAGIENLIYLALPEEEDLKVYQLFVNRHPLKEHIERIIAVEDGLVVAHAMLIPRTLVWDGVRVDADEVGFVATHPSYRNRGIMAALMKKAVSYLAERKKAVSIVYGIPCFYRQFGYEYAVPDDTFGPYTTISLEKEKKKSGKTAEYSTRPAKPSDIEKMEAMYNKQSDSMSLGCQRSRTDWLFQEAMISTLKNMKSVVLTDGSRFKGYARLQDGGIVREIAVEGLSNKENIKRYVSTLCILSGTDELKLGLARSHPFVEAAVRIGARKPGRLYGGYMRITNLKILLENMKKPIEQRTKDSGMEDYSGTILLDMYEQKAGIKFSSGKITSIGDTKGKEDVHIRVPPGVLIQLMTGYKEVLDVAETCDLLTDNDGLVMLGNMFPKRSPYIEYFDR